MCSLATFQPPPPEGYVTVCERNGELISGRDMQAHLDTYSKVYRGRITFKGKRPTAEIGHDRCGSLLRIDPASERAAGRSRTWRSAQLRPPRDKSMTMFSM